MFFCRRSSLASSRTNERNADGLSRNTSALQFESMSRVFAAAALLLLCGIAAAAAASSAVLELTPDNFDTAVKGHAALLVKFYAVQKSTH